MGLGGRHGRADRAARARRTGAGRPAGGGTRGAGTAVPARCTTAPSRCSRSSPAVVARSAVRQRNWPNWPASRSVRCGAWSAPVTPSRRRRRVDRPGRAAADARIRPGVGEPARRPGAAGRGRRRRSWTRRWATRSTTSSRTRGPTRSAYVLLEDLGRLGHGERPRRRRRASRTGRLEQAVGEGRRRASPNRLWDGWIGSVVARS